MKLFRITNFLLLAYYYDYPISNRLILCHLDSSKKRRKTRSYMNMLSNSAQCGDIIDLHTHTLRSFSMDLKETNSSCSHASSLPLFSLHNRPREEEEKRNVVTTHISYKRIVTSTAVISISLMIV